MTSKLTITRERLEKIKSWRETYGAGSNVMLPAEEAEELARMVLAAMDSEPDCKERKLFCSTDTARMRKVISVSAGTEDAPLYRHAQPAPVLMDEAQSRAAFEQWCTVNIERNKWHPEFYAHLPARDQWAAWEACRAIMLNGGKS